MKWQGKFAWAGLVFAIACGDERSPSDDTRQFVALQGQTTLRAQATAVNGTLLYRVNAGGAAIADTPGWSADTQANPSAYVNAVQNGNQTYATTHAIDMSDPSVPAGLPPGIMQSQRWDLPGGAEMIWNFAVSPGTYQVRLYFSEIYDGAQAPGQRVFDVSIENNLVLDNFDIYAAVGGYKTLVKTFLVASDSSLTIAFGHVVENPAIEAIEIIQPSGAPGSTFGFGKSLLNGESSITPTSLQFGPDGRLYVAQQDGSIKIYTISRNGANNYGVTQTQSLSLIQSIPNHNDDGTLNPNVATRQITGLLVAGTPLNPILYVSSSDPRIGGGSGGIDSNLDTNSGIVSRLTWSGTGWVKVDLVRGLPRSEENHSPNSMALDSATNTLYLAAGGNTNSGAPSHNFAYLPEVALSAAILSINLTAIGNATYDLPTLNDESRAGNPDANDPFGGNNGKNQAKLVPGGPVQVYAPGFRNAYDIALTQAGRMYTIDNGPNAGWGDVPINEGPAGVCTNGVNEPGLTQQDGLHFITAQGYYGGHPNPTRGNLANTFNATNPQSPVSVANPVECDYRAPGFANGAITLFPSSTNGIVEYTASNFGGAMQGDLLAAGFVYNTIYRLKLDASGGVLQFQENLFSSVGANPLDVTAQGDQNIFPGTIWVADLGANNIVVFEPNDYGGGSPQCSGADSPTLDEDTDGYTNADEIDNATNPCSAADVPPDWDHDFTSNLNDTDDDNDGQPDTSDPFAIDFANGKTTQMPVRYGWNSGEVNGGLFGLGFTGLMTNGASNYESLYDASQMTAGGAAGVATIDAVPEGDAYTSSNTQQYGFQFGVNATPAATGPFTVHTRILAPFGGVTPQDYQSMGVFIGTGDQDNYIKLVTMANAGAGGVQALQEEGGLVTSDQTAALTLPGPEHVDLFLAVDPAALSVQASYSATINGATGSRVNVGGITAIPSAWLNGLSGLAVGIISTSAGPANPFAASWDFIEATPDVPTPQALAKDTFTRATTNGWGTADTGGAWSLAAGAPADFSVNGSAGLVALAANSNEHLAYLPGATARDVDAQGRFSFSALPLQNRVAIGLLVLRRKSGGQHYRLGIVVDSAGRVFARGQRQNGNLFTDVNTGLTAQAGDWFYARAQATGASPTTLRVKVWKAGAAEPANWLTTVTDSNSALQASGAVGIRGMNTSSRNLVLTVDDFVAQPVAP